MGQHDGHAAIFCIQAGQHMQHKRVITLGSGRDTPIKSVVRVQLGRHFFLAFAVRLHIRQKAAVPLIQAEGGICNHNLEFHQLVIFDVLRVG